MDIDAGEAFAKVVETILKRGGDDDLARFNTPDFCLEDVMHTSRDLKQFLHIVQMLADLKGKFVEDITLHKIPPGAPDGYLGYFSIALRGPKHFIKKCDGNHAGPACRDAQCWV